jgi:hypothetical protein
MSDLDDLFVSFSSDLRRVEALLGLIKSFRDFGSSAVPDELVSGAVVWGEAMALKSSAPGLRTDLPLLSGSMVLYICGRFEHFVRQVVEAMCDDITGRTNNYVELPQALRDELKRRTLEVAQAPRKYGFTEVEAETLIVTLASNLDAKQAGSLRVVSRVVSVTDSNLNSRTLADLVKRVGMKDVWKDVGKQAPLKLVLNKQTDAECTADAVAQLDDLMAERNKIAHPTDGTSFPDPDQVLRSTAFLEALGKVLVDLCHVHLAGLTFNTAEA